MDVSRLSAVDKYRDLAFEAERYIWRHPETGYKEWNTSAYMEKHFRSFGYSPKLAGDIPGFTAELDTGRPGPTLLVFGELDSLLCPEHPEADPKTGACHVCGHNAQAAGLLALAGALTEPGILEGLCGKVRLCAVPAEELIEISFREQLREQGVIHYLGGKAEYLYRGMLDGCDIAFMAHTGTSPSGTMGTALGSNGNLIKRIRYVGKAAHAGGSPHKGINSLYAAQIGMTATNALRETFRDEQHVRYHPIVVGGGGAVNAIPSETIMESYVRASTLQAITETNKKINRALAASAASLGAQVILTDRVGYAPLVNDDVLLGYAEEAFKLVVPAELLDLRSGWDCGCTDMGDISAVMPSLHPYGSGASGTGHGKDYFITDPEAACIYPAKWELALIDNILANGAAKALDVISRFRPRYASKTEYFAAVDANERDGEAVRYNDDGTVTLLV